MNSGVQTVRVTGTPPNMPAGRLAVDLAAGALWVGRGPSTAPLLLMSFASLDAQYARLSGATFTGAPTYNADPVDSGHLARKAYVDSKVAVVQAGLDGFEATAVASFFAKTGGTVTGPITYAADPTLGNHLTRKSYVDTADGLRLPLTGGTITGPITYAADPTNANHLARKSYVDTAVAAIGGPYLPTAGGTITGAISYAADPTTGNQLARKSYVDAQAALNLTEAEANAFYLRLAGGTVTGPISYAADPSSANHLARKSYVDAQAALALTSTEANALYLRLTGGTLTGPFRVPAGGSTTTAQVQFGVANTGIYQIGTTNPINFTIAGLLSGRLDSGGALGASASIVTRAAGDARYYQQSEVDAALNLLLSKASNLADVASVSAARTNLGLGTMATATEGTGSTQFRDNAANDARFAAIADAWPGVTTTSSSSNVTFPIGEKLTIISSFDIARNESTVIRLDESDNRLYRTGGAGAVVTGTWRSRGVSSGGFFHMVRVA